MARGVVREWHEEDGWGVIDADETPGGCWAHFSHLRVPGYATATSGQGVSFEYEVAEQDGYRFRATEVTIDGVPRVEPEPPQPAGSAYQSRLTITWHQQSGQSAP